MPGVVGLGLSPDGERLVVATDASLRSLERDGSVAWELKVEAVDSAVLARRGALTVAYAQRRPLARKVFFLDRSGRRVGTLEPTEPVEAAAVSGDGRFAALAAGRSMIFCSVTDAGVRHRVITLDGHATQVQMGSGDTVYVACRDTAYVALLKSSGKELWRRQQAGVDRYSLSASADGRTVGISAQLPEDRVQTWLLTSRNSVRWTDVRPGARPRLRVSANGSAATLSYELRVDSPRGRRFERRLTYLAQGARGAWPKGGPFSAPLPVALDADGDWVVALDTQRRGGPPRFRLYGSGGERRWLYLSPAGILLASSSQDGRSIAVYRADRTLELLTVSAR